MSPLLRDELRAWAKTLGALALYEALTHAVDRVTLGSSNVALVAWGVATLIAVALRLWLVFVAPAWLIARAALAWRASRGAR